MSDDRVQQVIGELDPTPAHEAAWPVSRRQTLRALAAAGLLGAGSGSASAESAGTVIADEAVFSNYGSESVSDGWELTIDDDVFALTESDTETIGLPDGSVGEEVVLPGGGTASEVIAPDGSVVWEGSAIPDSAIHHWPMDEGSGGTIADVIGDADGTIEGPDWISNSWEGDFALEGDGSTDYVSTTDWGDFGSNMLSDFAIGVTFEAGSDDFDGRNEMVSTFRNGVDVGDMTLRLGTGLDGPGANEIGFQVRDQDNDPLTVGVQTDEYITDQNRHRFLINKTGNNADDIELWVDNSEQSTEIYDDDGFDNVANFDEPISIFARDEDDDHFDGVLDNIIVYGDSLSQSEIEDDYSRQPWS